MTAADGRDGDGQCSALVARGRTPPPKPFRNLFSVLDSAGGLAAALAKFVERRAGRRPAVACASMAWTAPLYYIIIQRMTKTGTMGSVRLDPALAAGVERHCPQTA